MQQRGLVCNIQNSLFEKLGIDYVEPCNKSHSNWSYLIFMINLSKESKTQDNPDLELIRKKILVKDLSWFPDLQLTSLEAFPEQQLTTQNLF